METIIGYQLTQSSIKQRHAFILAMTVIILDLFFIIFRVGYVYDARLSLSLIAFAILIYILDGDLDSIGLCLTPKQGWLPWIKISFYIGLVIAIALGIGSNLLLFFGYEIPIYLLTPKFRFQFFVHACLSAPMMEETIYRLILCVSLVPVIGPWRTIAISGLLFGFIHVLYGNPSAENLIGGFFLAWSFLKSESILIPIVLHSFGNFLAVCSHVIVWHLIYPLT